VPGFKPDLAKRQAPARPSKPEAIRRLIERGLAAPPPRKR